MPAISEKLKNLLEENKILYETIHHPTEYTAQETAADTHTPGQEFAKTVVLAVDGQPVMAVLPAHHKVDLDRLRDSLGAKTVALASEVEIKRLCPDCEVGAEPPFGNLYGVPVLVSQQLAEDERITFKAGSHQDVIRVTFRDYNRLVQPRVLDFSTAP
jgi:Ala-tRNA(Pro) deacylase